MTADPWGVPEPGPRTYWQLEPGQRPEPEPRHDRPTLYAVGSVAWRVLQLHRQHDLRADQARAAAQRRGRRLEHADAGVTRCSWCGEWRMATGVCEVRGCRSPWRLVATL